MLAFANGFIVSCLWVIFLVPVYMVKKAFSMPWD